jgi:hypothetical protein
MSASHILDSVTPQVQHDRLKNAEICQCFGDNPREMVGFLQGRRRQGSDFVTV